MYICINDLTLNNCAIDQYETSLSMERSNMLLVRYWCRVFVTVGVN